MSTKHYLDDLVIGTLPENVLEDIGKMQISLEDLQDAEEKKPPLSIVAKKGYIDVKLKLRIPTKKFILISSSVTGSLIAAAKIIAANWSTIQTLFQ